MEVIEIAPQGGGVEEVQPVPLRGAVELLNALDKLTLAQHGIALRERCPEGVIPQSAGRQRNHIAQVDRPEVRKPCSK